MADLNVSKEPIGTLFKKMEGKKFVVPDYQRRYAWDLEKCETLWNDLTNFEESRESKEEQYFLGTIVTYRNEDNRNEIEIIDGQQRITSLFLLLRSFYKKLEDMNETDNVQNLKRKIAPCLWETNELSGKVEDLKSIHIESKVATESENEILHRILEKGVAEKATNLYSKNYTKFCAWNDEYAQKQPMQWEQLVVTVLDRCVVLPIECQRMDLALTIFSTLNDRGMPLSDSDIFKSQMYKDKKSEEKAEFIDSWKELSERAVGNVSINDLFRYYTHVIRAKEGVSEREVALRKFYATNGYELLKKESILEDILDLGEIWRAIESRSHFEKNGNEIIDDEVLQCLHCLSCYPNEYWKYLVSVFYYNNKDKSNFLEMFLPFLKNVISFLFAKYIERPSVNHIKTDVYKMCIDIAKSGDVRFKYKLNRNFLKNGMDSVSKLSKPLVLLHAYLNKKQKGLLPQDFQIEHIFPKKWQDTNYNGWSKQDADLHLEKFGNKVAIDKKSNIQAGNKYFGQKKKRYAKSGIEVVKELAQYHKNDWSKADIEERDEKFKQDILGFFSENIRN